MKILVLCFSVVFFAFSSFAATYTWTDSQGNVNFTDDPGNVPPKYRKKMKILGGEETPPAEPEQKPSAKGKDEGIGEKGPGTKAPAKEKAKAVYGGKSVEAWKQEYGRLDADVKAAEKQLVETRALLNDTSNMSRTDYLTIQNTLRAQGNSVLMRRKQLDDFKDEAEKAGVPADLFEQ